MNKRIRKCLREEDQIDKKVAELLAHKADLEVARTQEEDKEIVRVMRGMNLEKHDLADLLDGLRNGEISLLKSDDFLDEEDGSTDAPGSGCPAAEKAPRQSEGHHDEAGV